MDESYIQKFISIGNADHSIKRRFRDIAALSLLVQNIASVKDDAARRGILYACDEARLLLALCPSSDECDLEMKASMLVGGRPMIKENASLMAMIDAGLIADAQRICPGHIPVELRRKFRN
jgi:hypothetical protein